MPMMNVRIVRMVVCNRRMRMLVRMWLAPVPRKIMAVMVVLVMHVAMGMDDCLVRVHVLMAFRKVEPDANRHEDEHHPEDSRDLLAKNQYGNCSPDEWGCREIRPRARRPQPPQGQYEQDQAHSVA